MNSHRHYEIYVFMSTDDIGSNDIKAWFEQDPQSFADWVRKNHSYEIYNNRRTTKDVIVWERNRKSLSSDLKQTTVV